MKLKSTAEYTKKLPKKLISICGIARFLVPPLIFAYPLFTTIAAALLDGVDSVLAFNTGWTWKKYLVYDKLLDWWWYVFIVLFSINKPIFLVIIILFIFRSIGQSLVIITRKSNLLIWFPNILELYFWIYLIFNYLVPKYSFLLSSDYQIPILLLCTLLALIREYYLHIDSSALEKFSFGQSWINRDG